VHQLKLELYLLCLKNLLERKHPLTNFQITVKHTFMKSVLMTPLFLLLLSPDIKAQYLEAGVFVGSANYKGDLAPTIELSEYRPAYGVSLRYNFTRYLSLKTNLIMAQVSGSDANLQDPRARERNLSFRSDVSEISVQGEFSPLGFDILAGKISSPYIFAGVGGFLFNPQAAIKGIWYDLQPLGTEGQGMTGYNTRYKRFSGNMPVGIGLRFSLNRRVNLGFEFGMRYTFTDYLDDVSKYYPDLDQLSAISPTAASLAFRRPELTGDVSVPPLNRGTVKGKDRYLIAGVTLSFNLTDKYGMEWEKKYRIYDKKK
jgi:Domain of unknown function (DUF6089)